MEEISIQSIITDYGLYLGTYIICLISGFVPIINAEIYLVIVSATITKSSFIPVLFLATVGQMTAKAVFYFSGMGIIKLSLKRYESKIDAVMVKMQKWKSKVDLLIFLSAFTGFPPFYVIPIVAGIIPHNFIRFFISGFTGRLLRFGLLMLFPPFFKELFT
jgi:membrane protein YqaA with SNARE-associated domain